MSTRVYAPEQRKTANAPVSAHPAFPAIVALWFAALLGLGSLVLPVALFERTAEATGLAALFPAAQAPLGLVARTVIAIAAAAIGAVVGIGIARKVVGAQSSSGAPTAPSMAHFEDADTVRPISAHEELGYDNLDSSAPEVETDGTPMSDAIAAGSHDPGAASEKQESEAAALAHGEWAGAPGGGADLHPQAPMVPIAPSIQAEAAPVPASTFPLASGEAGIAELVERFARALETRRAAVPANPIPDAVDGVGPRDAMADGGETAGESPEGPEGGAGYGSILAMQGPFGNARGRAASGAEHRDLAREAAPVANPSLPPRASGIAGHERALRDALEKLQRLSGAA